MRLLSADPYAISGGVHWVGVSSFETRCLAGLLELKEVHIAVATVWNYSTRLHSVATTRLTANRAHLTRTCERMSIPLSFHSVPAFRMSALRRAVANAIDLCTDRGLPNLVIDISCLTKIHAVALAEWLWERAAHTDSVRIFVQYTSPLQYGWQSSQHYGGQHFSELLFAPLGSRSPRSHVGRQLEGIALLGHEGARMRYALASFRFRRGLSILTQSLGDGDALKIAENENAMFLQESSTSEASVWEQATVERGDLERVASVVERFRSIEDVPTRTVLFPLGPKPVVVQAALTSLESMEADVWVSYPVPANYSPSYSIGVGSSQVWEVV